MSKIVFKNLLAFRLVVWFLLLSILPLSVVTIFVLDDVSTGFDELILYHQRSQAKLLAASLGRLPLTEAASVLQENTPDQNVAVFIVNKDGQYMLHSNENKMATSVNNDFSQEVVEPVLTGETGAIIDTGTGRVIGFAPIPNQTNIIVTVTDNSPAPAIISAIRRSSQIQLAASLLIVSIACGLAIWFVVGSPVRKLTRAAEQISQGNLDVEVDHEDISDELQVLALSFNQMTDQLRKLISGLEQKVAELEKSEFERKVALDAMRESEEKFRTIFRSEKDAIMVFDAETLRFIEANDATLDLYGYTKEEFLKLTPVDISAEPEQTSKFVKKIINHQPPDEVDLFERKHKRNDGTIFSAEISSSTFILGGRKMVCGIVRDITERKQQEDALRKYEHIVSSTSDLMSFIDRDYVYQAVNEFYLKAHQKEYAEIIGHSVVDLHGREVFNKVIKSELDRCLAGEEIRYQEWFDYPGIGRRFMDVIYTPYLDASGEASGIVVNIRDITERKLAEKALQESEERYRLLVENANEAIFIIKDGMVKFHNLKTEEMTGYSEKELSEIPFINIIHPDDREMVLERRRKRLLGKKPPSIYSFRMINKSGGELFVQINTVLIIWEGEPVTINFVRDITEQKRLEAQLQQAQKMESMGTLAGGIAHDFNNLLMGIQGRTSLMLMDSEVSHSDLEHLKGIEDYVKSAVDLTKQLLGFARGGKYEIKPTDLNEFIKKQNRMFGRTIKEITIRGSYEKNLWTTEIDQGQIEQVLLNLYVNSSQAMPGGGDLYIQTENIVIDESFNRPYHVEPGKYVKISVTDTGEGMDNATQQRIFDPFFTTKEIGRGTGLGLASAYGIIKNHGGFIDVNSKKGEGTTFNIYLPVSEKEAVKEKELHEELFRGSGTLLLVDDEYMIIDVGQGILNLLGFNVLTAKDGKKAIQVYKKNQDKIDMVILDMIMPEMGGGETYDKLKEINPGIKVLLSSGYSIDGEATKILERGCNGFIQKPFNMDDLSKKIREILEED